jgi:hypothetical protein
LLLHAYPAMAGNVKRKTVPEPRDEVPRRSSRGRLALRAAPQRADDEESPGCQVQRRRLVQTYLNEQQRTGNPYAHDALSPGRQLAAHHRSRAEAITEEEVIEDAIQLSIWAGALATVITQRPRINKRAVVAPINSQ